MLQTLLALILVFSSMTAARAIGMRVAGRWMETLHTGLKFSLAAALGLLIISYSVFFLVVFGWASQVAFWILSGIVVLILIVDPTCRGASLRSVTFWIASLTRRERLSLAGAVAYCLGILALVELPVTSVDELIYHLEIPHRLLESQGRYSFQDNIYAYFPQLGEMLFLFGYAVSGVSAARLFNAVFGLLLAVALYGFSRRSLSRADSFFAVAALFSAPSVLVVASLAYVDLVFTLYGFLALVLLLRFVQKRRLIWAVLAGVMGGGAWCTKYTGMQLLLLLVLIGLVGHLINKRKEFPWQLGMTIAVSLMVVTPYLLRNWIQTGWPLFPFDLGVFDLDPAINWDKERARLFLTWLSGFGTASEGFLWGRLVAPVRVFLTARFNGPGAYDGILGPLFLMAPLSFIGTRRRHTSILGLFCILFVCYWAFTTQQVRFLLPVLPVLAFLVALGTCGKGRRWLRVLALVLITLNLGLGLRQVLRAQPGDYWLGRQTEREYQAQRVIGFGIYQEAGRRIQPGQLVYLVNMRNLGYLLDCRWTADFVFEFFRLGKRLEQASDASDLLAYFKARNASHLMVDERVTLSDLALDRREQILFRTFLQDHCVLLARDSEQPAQSLWKIRY